MSRLGAHRRVLTGVVVLLALLAGCGAGAPAVDRVDRSGRAEPWPQRPAVEASLDMAPDLASATGTESVRFTPDERVCEVVFRNWPNRPATAAEGTSSTITNAAVDGTPVQARVEPGGAPAGAPGTLVTLPLPRCVDAGTTVRADLGFKLTLGADSGERIGYSTESRTAWMGTAVPLLAWVRGRGWVRDPAVRMPGETVASEEFRLDALRVTANADQAVTGTGTAGATTAAAPGRTTHTFTADSVRDMAVAAGAYAITEARAGDTRIHVAVPRSGARAPGQVWADEHVRALTKLQDLLGPYPYPDLWVTVSPTLSDGIEFPTHLQYGDVANRTRPSLVAHELSHEWFYSLVGNDQSRDPWLDESFATYAETVVANERDEYRLRAPGDPDVIGPIGAPMSYWDARGGFSPYSVGVYEQGAAALLAGRDRADAARFDAALRAYIDANAHRVGAPSDVEAAFRDLPQVLDVLRERGAFRSS